MSRYALIRQSDAQRLARVAKRENVVVCIRVDDMEITIHPDTKAIRREELDEAEEIIL